MRKHKLEGNIPNNARVPKNIPAAPKSRNIVADPPWQTANSGHICAVNHYKLLPLECGKGSKK